MGKSEYVWFVYPFGGAMLGSSIANNIWGLVIGGFVGVFIAYRHEVKIKMKVKTYSGSYIKLTSRRVLPWLRGWVSYFLSRLKNG